ncbi:MAG: hypothetical protein HZB42_11065 [Sphingobacteriales bacterium]|nr:hypothetical protein [Sphingobacteriales bacterium]
MTTRLMVNEKNQLREMRNSDSPSQPVITKWAAKIISYLFHPVFVPVYIILFILYRHPYLFAGTSSWDKTRILLMSVMMFSFFPIITVLLLKALNFINSVYLKTQKDRIIPLVACGVWYFWITYIWWNSNKMEGSLIIPKEAVRLALAVFAASWLALMANIKVKISLHAISMGVLVTFIILLAFSQSFGFGIYISAALFIAGLVCTSRFIVSDHSPIEVYGGLALGVLAMLVAEWVV